jgi:hypothetical protein
VAVLEDPFKTDDLVLLSTKHFIPPNLQLRPSAKLQPKYTGPYKIIKKMGTSYKLELPKTWSVHPEKLRPYYGNSNKPHPLSKLPIAERTIDKILAYREIHLHNGLHKQVLIQWKDHSPVYNVWMTLDSDLRQQIQHSFPNINMKEFLSKLPPLSTTLPSSQQKKT